MALPATLLQQFPSLLRGQAATRSPSVLPIGSKEMAQTLPEGGLPLGEVVELAVAGGAAVATSVALSACRAAQEGALLRGGEQAWCAFIDPSGTLYGPGVARSGVVLERLLVVRPSLEALSRVAIKLVESQAFAVAVIDLAGVPGASLDVSLGTWPRIVRRLALALEGTEGIVLLVTNADSARPLPLPVAQRIELTRPAAGQLTLRIAKDRRGRVSAPRTVAWARAAHADAQSIRRIAG